MMSAGGTLEDKVLQELVRREWIIRVNHWDHSRLALRACFRLRHSGLEQRCKDVGSSVK